MTETTGDVFRLAPMSAPILIMTLVAWGIPVALLSFPLLYGTRFLIVPAMLILAIFGWIWLRFRPTEFRVGRECLDVIWPLKHRSLSLADFTAVRVLSGRTLRQEIGFGMRVGAGGVWGGFGWLWTTRRGLVQMYVSRADALVWIERGAERPWLITPEQPAIFVQTVTDRLRHAQV
jgi:hypothetical protein